MAERGMEAMKYLLILLFTLVLCATAGGKEFRTPILNAVGLKIGEAIYSYKGNDTIPPPITIESREVEIEKVTWTKSVNLDSLTARVEVLEGEIHFPGYRIYPWVMFSVFCMWLILVILNAVLKAFEVHK